MFSKKKIENIYKIKPKQLKKGAKAKQKEDTLFFPFLCQGDTIPELKKEIRKENKIYTYKCNMHVR